MTSATECTQNRSKNEGKTGIDPDQVELPILPKSCGKKQSTHHQKACHVTTIEQLKFILLAKYGLYN